MSNGQKLVPGWYWIRPHGYLRSQARPARWTGDVWLMDGHRYTATGFIGEVISERLPHPDDRPTREAALTRAEAALAAWYGDGERPVRDMRSLLVSLAREAGWLVVKE